MESDLLLQRVGAGGVLNVPSIWPWEMMNAVAVAMRRQGVATQHAAAFLELLSRLDLAVAAAPRTEEMQDIYDLAVRNRLTAYDAAYPDLAMKLPVLLATLGRALADAARLAGVTLLDLDCDPDLPLCYFTERSQNLQKQRSGRSLNVKDPEVYRLAVALAGATGETITGAVAEALRQRYANIQARREKPSVEELLSIAARVSGELKGRPVDHAEYLYDDSGLPK